MDRIDRDRRSANMKRIRSADTSVELLLRQALRAIGLTGYRVHPKSVPGKPDVAFIRWKVAVFVDGCFWHACPVCYVRPSSNTDYWDKKRGRNLRRDEEVTSALVAAGWRVVRIWEHEVRADATGAALRVAETLVAVGRIS